MADTRGVGARWLAAVLTLALMSVTPIATRAALAEPTTTVLDNGPPANRVDIAILGDGYTAGQMGKFRTDVDRLVQGIFAQEPFREYSSYFNVHRVEVASPASGADHPERTPPVFVNTAFDASYGCAGIQRLICVNTSKTHAALARSLVPTQRDLQLLLVNDPESGGSGGVPAVSSADSPDAAETMLHELGHSFGQLADEYVSGGPACVLDEPLEANATAATARADIKWRAWIDPSTPVPTPFSPPGTVGLYQGARYCADGLYRPTVFSKMYTLGSPFERVNGEQLVRQVYGLVSPIDATTPTSSTVGDPGGAQTFTVSTLTPRSRSLDIAWLLDGQLVATSPEYTLDLDGLAPGTHTVKVVVTDPTAMVRSDPQGLLTDFREWTVPVPTEGGAFRPLAPTRILDTRNGPGPLGALGPGGSLDVRVTGTPGIPSTGVAAVVFNVTAVDPTAAGYLTVFPAGAPRPEASSLNFGRNQVVPNLVEVAVGAGGSVTLFNGSPGRTHYVIDVVGWVTTPAAITDGAGRYRPLTPERLLDTRSPPSPGSAATPLRAGSDLALRVAGRGPLPATGVAAVVLNVTVTNPSGSGWLAVYPGGGPLPLASSLNFVAGQTVPNRVVVALGGDGSVGFHLGGGAGSADVVADVAGWFGTSSAPPGGSLVSAVGPTRITDTRPGSQVGPRAAPLGPAETLTVQVAGTPGVPSMTSAKPPTAAVLNVTVTATTGGGYLTVFPSGAAQPLASDQNWTRGTTRANLVVAKLGPDGRIAIAASAGSTTHVIVDVLGFTS